MSQKKYTDTIDVETEWEKNSDLTDSFGSPDDFLVVGVYGERADVTYRQLALLQSRLGYTKLFFKESPATHNGKKATFEGFWNHMCVIE